MFNVYKSRRSGGLTTLPERVVRVLVHGPLGDSAAGPVSEVVSIACPAVGSRGVCSDCCDGGIGDGRVGLGAVVVSEGRSLVEGSVTGCLVVTTKAEQFLRSVPLLVSSR